MESGTHSLILAGAGGVIAGDTVLGQITLPANGPYLVHHAFGTVVNATPTAAQAQLCSGVIRSVSGDVTPNPSPFTFPIMEAEASLGVTINRGRCETTMIPIKWQAAGKAVMDLILRQYVVSTVAPQAVMGVIFGKKLPTGEPATNMDSVRAAVAVAAEAAVGVITLATSAKKIVGIMPVLAQNGVVVTLEELIGWVRLASDDIDLAPSQWPFLAGYGAGLGALINGSSGVCMRYWPVDIPVPGGARITVTVDLNTAVTNAAEVICYLLYN